MAKKKYYVVWKGKQPGIYDTWEECLEMTKGFPGAQYKSFDTMEGARVAFSQDYDLVKGEGKKDIGAHYLRLAEIPNGPELNALAVDAACSGNPGVMEYQGVIVGTKQRVFHFKCEMGTNNVGEFLALVHGLSYLKKHNLAIPIYSDSRNAINWVGQKICKSKLAVNPQTAMLWDYVHRAEAWLHNNTYSTAILKWETDLWGEIPADFGRK